MEAPLENTTNSTSSTLLEKQALTLQAENSVKNTNSDPKITLTSDSKKSTAEIYLHGATVTSWKVNNKERIFCSSKAIFNQENKGIRGGIPLVFPNFGPWGNYGPQHGFARIQKWELIKKTDRSCTLELKDNEKSRKMWDNKFTLTYTIKVTDNKLITTLNIKNENEFNNFDFTTLLHTYLKVPEIDKIEITGLENAKFTDSLLNNVSEENEEKSIFEPTNKKISNIEENVDKIFQNTENEHILSFFEEKEETEADEAADKSENTKETKIIIRKTNLPDTVLWNPWIEKAKKMSDFGDDEYKNMICIEAGYVNDRKILKPMEVFQCEQVLEEEQVQEINLNETSED